MLKMPELKNEICSCGDIYTCGCGNKKYNDAISEVLRLNSDYEKDVAKLVEALDEISHIVDDQVDITNEGHPNTAMKISTIIESALAPFRGNK